jgi:hypothetical protein
MKKYNTNQVLGGGTCFCIILGIFVYLSILILQPKEESLESFTPGIRQAYRPYVRQTRILSEGFYDKSENHVLKLLRKFDLY